MAPSMPPTRVSRATRQTLPDSVDVSRTWDTPKMARPKCLRSHTIRLVSERTLLLQRIQKRDKVPLRSKLPSQSCINEKKGGFGAGLNGKVCEAYNYITNNYGPGDELFIFGFSRGAYTARVLASFICNFGLLTPGMMGMSVPLTTSILGMSLT